VRDHLRRLDVAKFKWPERVELLDALPRTKVGKLDKKAMTADIAARLEDQ
jgi:2,3-dihydroxybenzoate-AMP ligase